MYTDSQLARDAESHYDLTQDRHDEEGARQDWHAARVADVLKRLEPRMVRYPTPDEFSQAMSNVLPVDSFRVSFMWQFPHGSDQKRFEEIGRALCSVVDPELRKMADTAAEAQVQREEREQEGEVRRVRRVVLGDEL
jgi:hypothetical protein